MRLFLAAVGLAAMGICTAASAQVTGSVGGGGGPYLTLSSSGLNGGSVATLSGGSVQTADQPFADIPKADCCAGDAFLAAGPSVGNLATFNFTTGVDYLSFLWGSPDTYNLLTITTDVGAPQVFTTALLGLPGDGNQSFSSYVQFSALPGSHITSASFTNDPAINAFEAANFSVTAGVPEPATWAMMLIGFGGVGFQMRRSRKRSGLIAQAA